MTESQRRTMERIRARKKPIKSDRGTAKKERAMFARSAAGILQRRAVVKEALIELGTCKRQELRKSVKGRRLSKKVTAEDVQKWFYFEKNVKFSIETIKIDLRTLRKNR